MLSLVPSPHSLKNAVHREAAASFARSLTLLFALFMACPGAPAHGVGYERSVAQSGARPSTRAKDRPALTAPVTIANPVERNPCSTRQTDLVLLLCGLPRPSAPELADVVRRPIPPDGEQDPRQLPRERHRSDPAPTPGGDPVRPLPQRRRRGLLLPAQDAPGRLHQQPTRTAVALFRDVTLALFDAREKWTTYAREK